MKYKYRLFFLLGFLTIALVVNSCKKESQNNIEALLTTGQWQLASLQVTHYLGALQGTTDTLGTKCLLTQIFKFNTDKTCTYSSFDCVPQPAANGKWALSSNQLVLYSDMICRESTTTRDSTITEAIPVTTVNDTTLTLRPFATAKILNLGQYSLVLQTGNLETYYQPTQKRTVITYGFIRQKTQ